MLERMSCYGKGGGCMEEPRTPDRCHALPGPVILLSLFGGRVDCPSATSLSFETCSDVFESSRDGGYCRGPVPLTGTCCWAGTLEGYGLGRPDTSPVLTGSDPYPFARHACTLINPFVMAVKALIALGTGRGNMLHADQGSDDGSTVSYHPIGTCMPPGAAAGCRTSRACSAWGFPA